MRSIAFVLFCLVSGFAWAAEPCPDNPSALGTSRIITINPGEFSRIGSLNYKQTLPLDDHEVVITFDDGPIPPYSNIILDTLASQCVKATYFLIGAMAHSHPSIVRRIYNAGHSIGSHSQNHPFKFQRLSMDAVEHEVDDGIASIDVALGDPKALSPFFRIPGFGRTEAIDDYLASKALVTWSTDIVADDWKRIGAREIVRRAMRRLDAKGRGILLLHDIHPATVLALPILLKELKDRGYRVVHVVATGDHPETIPEPSATTDSSKEWPRVTAVPSAPPVHTLQRHHPKKRHPNRHRTEERT